MENPRPMLPCFGIMGSRDSGRERSDVGYVVTAPARFESCPSGSSPWANYVPSWILWGPPPI